LRLLLKGGGLFVVSGSTFYDTAKADDPKFWSF
jgi:hypothetical protein